MPAGQSAILAVLNTIPGTFSLVFDIFETEGNKKLSSIIIRVRYVCACRRNKAKCTNYFREDRMSSRKGTSL